MNYSLIFIVFWGDVDVIEILLSKNNYILTFGALECFLSNYFLTKLFFR